MSSTPTIKELMDYFGWSDLVRKQFFEFERDKILLYFPGLSDVEIAVVYMLYKPFDRLHSKEEKTKVVKAWLASLDRVVLIPFKDALDAADQSEIQELTRQALIKAVSAPDADIESILNTEYCNGIPSPTDTHPYDMRYMISQWPRAPYVLVKVPELRGKSLADIDKLLPEDRWWKSGSK